MVCVGIVSLLFVDFVLICSSLMSFFGVLRYMYVICTAELS